MCSLTLGDKIYVQFSDGIRQCIIVNNRTMVAKLPKYDVVFDKGLASVLPCELANGCNWRAVDIRFFSDMNISSRSNLNPLLQHRLIEAKKCTAGVIKHRPTS